MNQSYFLKNLPAPLQFWVRPMLLISLGLHGILMATPMPSQRKPEAPKKEPEKVKITQLPTTSSSPAPKPSPVVPKPKPSLVLRQPNPPQPNPIIRQPTTVIPPVTTTKSIPRPTPSPTPEQAKPSPSPEQAKPSPSPEQAKPSPSPEPSTTPEPTPNPATQNPFADFPIYPNTQGGSLGLLSGDTDKSARNTTDGLDTVVAFYNKELPARKFNPKPLPTDDPNLKIYEVSKDGGEFQFLHLISKDGKTVIVLASQQITDLKILKDAQTRSPEEITFYDNVLKPLENDENLILNSVEPGDIAKIPEANKFADPNKFEFRTKTGKLAPKSPQELFSIYEAQLSQNGFTQISPEASYGGGLTYKVTQGNFKIYIYFVVNTDNNTVVILSKDSPF